MNNRNDMFKIFTQYPNILATISHRSDGDMKVRKEIEGDRVVIENKERFLKKLGVDPQIVVRPQLEHGANIEIVGNEAGGNIILHVDGLITSEANLYLSVTLADCLPVFLFAPDKHMIALLHAGWMGLDARIIAKGVSMMKTLGCDPSHMLAALGPSIGPCHYSVDEERAKRFRDHFPEAVISRNSLVFLNLSLIANMQLLEAGISPAHIEIHPDCTYCKHELYFSHRYDKLPTATPMMAVFGRRL